MMHLRQSAVSRASVRSRHPGLLQGACFALAFAFMVAMVLGLIG